MEVYIVYILYSFGSAKSYVGFTNDIERRIWEHNHASQSSYTSRFRPWVVVYTESFKTKKEAMQREKWYKSGIGRKAKDEIVETFLTKK